MNVLFLTLCDIRSFQEHQIYSDLLREFIRDGHLVYCISPLERRMGIKTYLAEDGKLLKLKILNIQKTNVFEKGVSTILVDYLFLHAIKRFFGGIKFDLLLYSTPPITFVKTIEYVKKHDHAKTYLMLKDIFPQNAIDLGMLKKNGLKGALYRYFRKKEKKLYALSDKIGCMSSANIRYIIENNSSVDQTKLELCPNCIEYRDLSLSESQKNEQRKKYSIPMDKLILVYGGNLGKPQGIPFLIKAIESQKENEKVYFLIVGDGTEYSTLERAIHQMDAHNVKLMKNMPKDDYEKMIPACDVGLIFLDYRFTIPNYPSRLLSYMQASLPVLACTDEITDIGRTIIDGGFGWWCKSSNIDLFKKTINIITHDNIGEYGIKSKKYLLEHFTSRIVYDNMSIHG